MKRSSLAIAVLALAFTGCNTCSTWRPANMFGKFKSCLHGANNVGAPCDAGCETGGMEGCQSCGETARYGGYGETVIGSYETPISSSVSGGTSGISIGSSIPSGSVLPPTTTGGYTTSPNPASSIRPETIRPKPAN